MYLSFGIFFQACLLVVGLIWLYQMAGKCREHVDVLRTGEDNLTKGVIVGMWAVTAAVGILVVTFVVSLGLRIVGGVMGLV